MPPWLREILSNPSIGKSICTQKAHYLEGVFSSCDLVLQAGFCREPEKIASRRGAGDAEKKQIDANRGML